MPGVRAFPCCRRVWGIGGAMVSGILLSEVGILASQKGFQVNLRDISY